jgi:hypothetical protein
VSAFSVQHGRSHASHHIPFAHPHPENFILNRREKENFARKKKLVNNSGIPQHAIESIARCILPDILAYYESEEGQREFWEWKAKCGAEQTEGKTGEKQ